MKTDLIQTYDTAGLEAALVHMQTASLPHLEQVPSFNELLCHAYWQAKDLPAVVVIGQAGIRQGEALIDQHLEEARIILAQIKGIYYNLASFTWPGWDEEGIEITSDQAKLGLKAAHRNLELAIQLQKPPLPLSRAYWMLAAQQLAAGDYVQAQDNFSLAEKTALEARKPTEALLAVGFVQVAVLMSDPRNINARSKLNETKFVLRYEENGEMFVKQLEDALRIFGEHEW